MLDFTNIFEISISIVTAMMGLSYPLFLDKVNGIDSIYKNLKFSKKFEKEFLYKSFNILLILCLVELFLFPFIIIEINNYKYEMLIITVQTICVLALTMNMHQVYILLMIYNAPEKLMKRIKASPDSPQRLDELEIMLEFASTDFMYRDIASECLDEITKAITNFQNEEMNRNRQ